MSRVGLLAGQPVLFHPVAERVARYPEPPGRRTLIALLLLERTHEEGTLHGLERASLVVDIDLELPPRVDGDASPSRSRSRQPAIPAPPPTPPPQPNHPP